MGLKHVIKWNTNFALSTNADIQMDVDLNKE